MTAAVATSRCVSHSSTPGTCTPCDLDDPVAHDDGHSHEEQVHEKIEGAREIYRHTFTQHDAHSHSGLRTYARQFVENIVCEIERFEQASCVSN